MSAFNKNGGIVNVGDNVSIQAYVVSYTGTGGTARVTVQPLLTTSTFVANANDMQAAEQFSDSSHQCTSIGNAFFGAANDPVTILGKVSAISGSGNTAQLTVVLITSGASVFVPAGSCNSDNV